MVGRHDLAIDQIEYVLPDSGYAITPMELRLDRLWDPLRDHPRFQELLEKYEQGCSRPSPR